MAKRDYYEVLGVDRKADGDAVKKAHRRLARQFHPDMNKSNPDAAKRFQEVQEAYDVLSDPVKRQAYDEFGHAGPMPGGDPFGGFRPGGSPGGSSGAGRSRRQWTPGGGATPEDFGVNPQDFGNGQFGEIFEQLFGQKGPFGRQPQPGYAGGRGGAATAAPRPADVEYPVTLTFEQAARGSTLPLKIDRGDGAGETIEIKVPAGVKTGSRVRVKGRGERGPGGASGDLYIVVSVGPHTHFRREGLDVVVDAPVSVYDAMLGGKVDVPTVDGQVITLRVPPGTSGGTKLRVKGRGVYRGAEKGDQLVVVQVVVPKELSDEDKALVEQLRDRRPVEVAAE